MDREVVYGDRPGFLCTALGRYRVWSRLCGVVTQSSGCWPWDTVPVIAAASSWSQLWVHRRGLSCFSVKSGSSGAPSPFHTHSPPCLWGPQVLAARLCPMPGVGVTVTLALFPQALSYWDSQASP